jgi:hypothetical protein
MVNALREEFIYAEKRARDFFFMENESILHESGPPVLVSRLTREAAHRARMRAQQVGYDLQNWSTASKATINAMLGAGVLLDLNGLPIPLNIAAPAAEVWALSEGFADATEAYLLEAIICRLRDVTARDHTALAHALFRQFDRSISMGDLEDRVVLLLATLSERVALGEGGVYSPIASGSIR